MVGTTTGLFTKLRIVYLPNRRDLLADRTKFKESICKYNNKIYSTVGTRTRVLSTDWTRMWPSTALVSKWWWAPFAWIVHVVPQNVWMLHFIDKYEDDQSLSSPSFLKRRFQSNFSEIFKRTILDTKHYQLQSEMQGRCKVGKKSSRRCCKKCALYMLWNISRVLACVV